MNKQCEIVQDLLPLYVDGVCSKASTELVKEHLETCTDCRAIYEQMCSYASEMVLKQEKDGIIKRHEKNEKKKSRRNIILAMLLSFVACLGIILACMSFKPVTIDYGNSDIYSREDMDTAVELIKRRVDSWKGCKLYSVCYTDDGLSERELAYCNQIAEDKVVYTECMVFRASFRSPILGGYSWNANYVYDWTWYLARTENSDWELIMWGIP